MAEERQRSLAAVKSPSIGSVALLLDDARNPLLPNEYGAENKDRVPSDIMWGGLRVGALRFRCCCLHGIPCLMVASCCSTSKKIKEEGNIGTS